MDERAALATIGGNLRAERARRNWSQEDFAHRADMAVTQIARMERGEVDSGITKYIRLTHALGIDPSALLVGVADVASGRGDGLT